MHKVRMVFYAMIEELQRLTVELRLWREAQEAAVLDPVAGGQIQENAIFSAGVLGHWITDSARLAEGASMLRDAWYSAWIQSGKERLSVNGRIVSESPERYRSSGLEFLEWQFSR